MFHYNCLSTSSDPFIVSAQTSGQGAIQSQLKITKIVNFKIQISNLYQPATLMLFTAEQLMSLVNLLLVYLYSALVLCLIREWPLYTVYVNQLTYCIPRKLSRASLVYTLTLLGSWVQKKYSVPRLSANINYGVTHISTGNSQHSACTNSMQPCYQCI